MERYLLTIYVDLDGVIANYDAAANAALNTYNHYHYEYVWGPEVYWKRLHAAGNFFGNLMPYAGAHDFWNALKDAGHPRAVLTALPKTGKDAVDAQKRKWVKDHIDDQAKVITCMTVEKPNYCEPGDILIDDRAVNRDAWIAKGGTYIIHTTFNNTLAALRALGVIH